MQQRGGRRITDSSLRVGAPHTHHTYNSFHTQHTSHTHHTHNILRHNTQDPTPPMSDEEADKTEPLGESGLKEVVTQDAAECQISEDSEWSINAYNNRSVLHMICSLSALPLCRAGRSTPSQLAMPVATGKRLCELSALGEFSGEICRRCESKCSSRLVQGIRDAVAFNSAAVCSV